MSFNSYNDFSQQPLITYQILEYLMKSQEQTAEDFWKCLYYMTADALEQPNLTLKQKKSLIWVDDVEEQHYKIFMKPIVGSALTDSNSQTQFRLYRWQTIPDAKGRATVCYKFDFITNEKVSMVYYNDVLCERSDVLESLFLATFNGKDIGIGSSYLAYDRELTRNCNSSIGLTNSKTLYGRSAVMAMIYIDIIGDVCY